MTYVCPVCGYTEMIFPPKDEMICPCCGVQFGYDDITTTYAELRQEWIENGMPWFSSYTSPPPDWVPGDQLAKAGYAE